MQTSYRRDKTIWVINFNPVKIDIQNNVAFWPKIAIHLIFNSFLNYLTIQLYSSYKNLRIFIIY